MSLIRFISRYRWFLLGTVAIVVVVLVLFIEPSEKFTEIGSIILVPATFLYGIFAGFYLSLAVTDSHRMREATLEEIGALDVIANTLVLLDDKLYKKFKIALDNYIQQVLEVEAIDASLHTEPEYKKISKLVYELDPALNSISIIFHRKVYDTLDHFYDARQKRYLVSGRIIGVFSWLVLGLLSSIITLGFLFQRNGVFLYDVLIVMAAVAITAILLVIYEIDNYTHREEIDVFGQYRVLYKDLDFNPYYPCESILYKRANPTLEPMRIGFPVKNSRKRRILEINPKSKKELLRAVKAELKNSKK